ncbi:unnamed protein product [Gadus morhua 'NCC']
MRRAAPVGPRLAGLVLGPQLAGPVLGPRPGLRLVRPVLGPRPGPRPGRPVPGRLVPGPRPVRPVPGPVLVPGVRMLIPVLRTREASPRCPSSPAVFLTFHRLTTQDPAESSGETGQGF